MFHTVTLRQQGESHTALNSIIVPFHWKYCRIMRRHQVLASGKGKQNPFHSESEVSLRKPAAVHCQVVTPTVLKPVCMMLLLCRNYHCVDRTHARTHSHLQWERLAISLLKISAHGRSWTQTHTATIMSFFYGRDFAYRSDLHIHSLSIGVSMQHCIET